MSTKTAALDDMRKSDFVVFWGIVWFFLCYCFSTVFRASLEAEAQEDAAEMMACRAVEQ